MLRYIFQISLINYTLHHFITKCGEIIAKRNNYSITKCDESLLKTVPGFLLQNAIVITKYLL